LFLIVPKKIKNLKILLIFLFNLFLLFFINPKIFIPISQFFACILLFQFFQIEFIIIKSKLIIDILITLPRTLIIISKVITELRFFLFPKFFLLFH